MVTLAAPLWIDEPGDVVDQVYAEPETATALPDMVMRVAEIGEDIDLPGEQILSEEEVVRRTFGVSQPGSEADDEYIQTPSLSPPEIHQTGYDLMSAMLRNEAAHYASGTSRATPVATVGATVEATMENAPLSPREPPAVLPAPRPVAAFQDIEIEKARRARRKLWRKAIVSIVLAAILGLVIYAIYRIVL